LGSAKILYDDLSFKPVTPERWDDLEELFGQHGAYGGCWCMWWRIKRSEFERNHGSGNRQALKRIVDAGMVPGILAYLEKEPIGWCSVAPREQFPVLDRSPVLKRVDQRAVWSIVCFFIVSPFRRRGLSSLLIRGALEYARGQGATIVEAYPVDRESSRNTSLDAFTGFARTFERLGFREVERRSASRPILRYFFEP
jgi:GNAT superfamily N-acetyltransferase